MSIWCTMNTKLFCAFHQHDQRDQGVLDLKMKSLILNDDAQHDISNVHELGCIQISIQKLLRNKNE